MAIDSETKRVSTLNAGTMFPGRTFMQSEPDGSNLDDANERGFVLWHYAGIAAGAISITITAFDATWDGSGEVPEAIYRNVTSSTNTITIAGKLVGGVQQTIDGDNSITVSGAYFSILLKSDGTNLMKFD